MKNYSRLFTHLDVFNQMLDCPKINLLERGLNPAL